MTNSGYKRLANPFDGSLDTPKQLLIDTSDSMRRHMLEHIDPMSARINTRLLSIPFRILGAVVSAFLAPLKATLMLPARALGHRG